jgi:hypothetical protein
MAFSSRYDVWPDISDPQEQIKFNASKVGLPNPRILVIGVCMNVVWTTGPAKTQPDPKRGSEKTRPYRS